MHGPHHEGVETDDDELDIRGDRLGSSLSSQKGSRKAALIRPVSARSYENAAAAELESPTPGEKPSTAFRQMGPNKGGDFLSGSGAAHQIPSIAFFRILCVWQCLPKT
jgi:hypothetical protein